MDRQPLFDAMEQYEEVFDDTFPRSQMTGRSDAEILQIISECIKKKKDVYDLGYLTLDDDVLY